MRELQGSLRNRHPDSIANLIQAAKDSDDLLLKRTGMYVTTVTKSTRSIHVTLNIQAAKDSDNLFLKHTDLCA